MSMTYADLKNNVEEVTENTFTAAQHKLFTQLAEQTLLNAAQIPALRKVETTTTSNGDNTLALPSDYLYTFSIKVKDSNNVTTYLLPKDNSFLQEAFPDTDDTDTPKFYAQLSDTEIQLAPTPNANISLTHTYAHYPTSLVDVESDATTWLSENMSSALLNAALVEAARFMKAEPDVVAMYKEQLANAITIYKQLADGKLRTDVYRNGQPTTDIL